MLLRSIIVLASFSLGAASTGFAAESAWVRTGATGRLIYVPDAQGDRILDFSNAGYRGLGLEALPDDVPTSVTLSPIAGDDTANIQAAIDQVSALPVGADGYRGAVLLTGGVYDIHSQLRISASGVVLRGVGDGANDTVLHGRNVGAAGTNQRPLVEIHGNGNLSNTGSTRQMIDKVVPAGSRSFRVNTVSGLAVGDTVRVERPSTQAWIDAIGMDNPPNGDPPWTSGSMNIRYDRVITRIEGNRVFVDAPLANSFELQYGGGTIRRYTWSGAIENVGVENLRGDSDFDSATDEDHAWEFISIGDSQSSDRAQNVWVRNITARHFGDSAVVANPSAKWVTVDNAVSIDPVSEITGSRRYTYDLSGDLGLVANSTADEGRHDFVNNSTRPRGPNVFYNSSATNANSDSGPHQRWATGTLFDNITVDGDAINARNRGSFGTAHGWSGANMVVWNSTADSYRVQNPPTSQNWLIGSSGTIVEDTTFGPQPSGNYDSHGAAVTVGGMNSLYEAQRNDARDIRSFQWGGGNGNWSDATQWQQQTTPGVYAISLRDYLVGDIDDYVDDGNGSVDDAFVDPAWEAFILGSSNHPVVGFDQLTTNQNVAFTAEHVLDAGERVVHASLALALKQSGGDVATDFVRIIDDAPEHRFDFTDLGWANEINASETFVGVLDLGPFLAHLQSGAVNVQVNDDVGVDWALYTATVATQVDDGSLPSVWIDGGTSNVDTAVDAVQDLFIGTGGAAALTMASPAEIAIAGDFQLGPSGALTVELGDSQSGAIEVQGEAVFDGTLTLVLEPGFAPSAGEVFALITSGNATGEFTTINLPDLDDDLLWKVDLTAGLSAAVLASADFDANGAVDGADLGRWQGRFGAVSADHADGDANGDGAVSGRDFLLWQQQQGASSAEAASTAVPESSSVWIIAMAALVVGRRKRLPDDLSAEFTNTFQTYYSHA